MVKITTSGVVRAILSDDINLSADEVIAKARTKGLKASDESIRGLVYNIRGELKKAQALVAPAAAHESTPPKAVAPAATPTLSVLPTMAPFDLTAVLANVALVNTIGGQCGGVENARRTAEAVRACGGVESFLQHLDLIAGLRTADVSH